MDLNRFHCLNSLGNSEFNLKELRFFIGFEQQERGVNGVSWILNQQKWGYIIYLIFVCFLRNTNEFNLCSSGSIIWHGPVMATKLGNRCHRCFDSDVNIFVCWISWNVQNIFDWKKKRLRKHPWNTVAMWLSQRFIWACFKPHSFAECKSVSKVSCPGCYNFNRYGSDLRYPKNYA